MCVCVYAFSFPSHLEAQVQPQPFPFSRLVYVSLIQRATLCGGTVPYRNREPSVELDLVQLDVTGRFKLDMRRMVLSRLPHHEGPPIAARRLGNDIPAAKKPAAFTRKSFGSLTGFQ